ncbi:MAG: hypothetical protein PHP62_02155 [Candidatus Moranbacteria bacterium]|nr:hypothetical protein [Candidatus Moranbacteria bacterium]
MNKKQYLGLLVMLVVAVLLAFYWYSYRPSQLKKDCANWSLQTARDLFAKEASIKKRTYLTAEYDKENYNDYFERCLREKGLTD